MPEIERLDWSQVPLYGLPICGWKILVWRADYEQFVTPWYGAKIWSKSYGWHSTKVARCTTYTYGLYKANMRKRAPEKYAAHEQGSSPIEGCSCGWWSFLSLPEKVDTSTDRQVVTALQAGGAWPVKEETSRVNNYALFLVQSAGRFFANQISMRAETQRYVAICNEGPLGRERLERFAEQMGIPALSLKEMREWAPRCGIDMSVSPSEVSSETKEGDE